MKKAMKGMEIDVIGLPHNTAHALEELGALLGYAVASGENAVKVSLMPSDKNSCELKHNVFRVGYCQYNYIFRAMRRLAESGGEEFALEEQCAFERLGVTIDCSRNAVYTVSALKKLIRILAACGYNTMSLYTEDTYEVKNEPYFGYLRGRYSAEELKEADKYAGLFGIELIPCIQTLAHLNSITRWKPYHDAIDMADVLLSGADRTYELIENMFSSIAENFVSRTVNIGMDEAHLIGRGRYLDIHGYQNRFDIMINHLRRVKSIADKYGFKITMWSDMFFKLIFGEEGYPDGAELDSAVLEKIPQDIGLIYWDYRNFSTDSLNRRMQMHNRICKDTWYAGAAWTYMGMLPLNSFSNRAIALSVPAAKNNGIKNYLLTMWGDNGGECSPFAAMPVYVTTAEKAYGHDEQSAKKSFRVIMGCEIEDFNVIELPNRIMGAKEFDNPSKYLLYNDCFLGVMDSSITEGGAEELRDIALKLKAMEDNKQWGYIFCMARLLTEVLYLKYDLGVITRRLYKGGDRLGLSRLINAKYKPLTDRLEEFYAAYESYWNTEKKPHGFDVQDIRLGGLIGRTRHCCNRLEDYVQEKTTSIAELEEIILDYGGNGLQAEKRGYVLNNFLHNISVNVF